MNRQQPLALAPPAGDADWSERSLLDGVHAPRRCSRSTSPSSTSRSSSPRRGGSSRFRGLPPRAIDSLIDLEAGPRLCDRLPFALFDLRFGDGASGRPRWRRPGGVQDAAGVVGGGRAHRRLHACGDHGHLAPGADARGRAHGSCSAHRPRPSRRSRAMPVAAVERLARGVRGFADGALRFARALLAAVRGLRSAARPARPSTSLRQLGLQIHGADSARGQSLQRRHRRNVA